MANSVNMGKGMIYTYKNKAGEVVRGETFKVGKKTVHRKNKEDRPKPSREVQKILKKRAVAKRKKQEGESYGP